MLRFPRAVFREILRLVTLQAHTEAINLLAQHSAAHLQQLEEIRYDLVRLNLYLDTLTTKIDFAAVPEDNVSRRSASDRISSMVLKKADAEAKVLSIYRDIH